MATLLIALCVGLNASLDAVRTLGVSSRTFSNIITASESPSKCVFINPCTQLSSHDLSTPVDTLLWRGNPNLQITEPSGSGTRRNLYNTEFVRAPAGVVVEACTPHLEELRNNSLSCSPKTTISVSGHCPPPYAGMDLYPIDCLQRLEYDATSEQDLILSTSTDNTVFKAAIAGSAQLIKWKFVDNYGCYDKDNLIAGKRLSRVDKPNRIDDCPVVANSVPILNENPLACDYTCKDGYERQEDRCVWSCGDAVEAACDDGFMAIKVCDNPETGVTSYKCEQCPLRPGSQVNSWTLSNPSSCVYSLCTAGTFSPVGKACQPCPKDTFSGSNATACTACADFTWSDEGASVCQNCFAAAPSGASCPPGFYVSVDSQKITLNHVDLDEFCRQGYACLACAPGTYESSGQCVECAQGSFQSNYASTTCIQCADTQTTHGAHSRHASDCVCDEGHTAAT